MKDRPDQNAEPEPRKRLYQKPEISRVPLRPEEAVLGSCKSSTGSGSTQANCSVPSPCSSFAS